MCDDKFPIWWMYGVVTLNKDPFNNSHRANTKGRGFSANYGIEKILYNYKRHLNYSIIN
jgi:hypothetical protein